MNPAPAETDQPARSRRRRLVWLGSLLVAVLVGALLATFVPREPSYQGQSLSAWLSRAQSSGPQIYGYTGPNFVECRTAIRAMGTNAIPPLLRILRAKDSFLKRGVMELLDRQNFFTISIPSAETRAELAEIGFYLLGDLATNAVPALVDICRDARQSYYAKGIADRTLKHLYPAKSVEFPFWELPENRAQWYLDAGLLQSQSDNYSNALLAFSQAIQLEPTNVSAYIDRAQTRLQLMDLTDALVDFDHAIALEPTNSPALIGRGLCKFGLKDFTAAETDFTAAIQADTNNATALNYRGLARANLRNFDAALSDLNQAIQMNEYDAAYFRNRAMVEAVQTDYELALADADKSLLMERKDPSTWSLRGRIRSALKDFRAAITDADQAIQLNPKDSIAYSSRAMAYLCLNEFEAATRDVESALKLNPKNAPALIVRALIAAKCCSDDAAALAALQQAVEVAPHLPDTYGMLGLYQYKAAQWEPALANCRKALAMGALTSLASYRSYIWLIRAQSGQEPAATEELEAYLQSVDSSKTNDWSAITARFFTGNLPESNYLNLAITAARRPSAVTNQMCEAFYYAAMKRKLAGDKPGALTLFRKSLDTKDDNCMAYLNAVVELRALQKQ